MPSLHARAPKRECLRLYVGAFVAALFAIACTEPTLPLPNQLTAAPRATLEAGVLPSGVPLGIGGAYTLDVSGPYVTYRDPSPSGITLIPGIPVEVIVSGQITRQMTDGFVNHCALLPFTCPDFVRSNAPFGPGGLDGTGLGAATSWWDDFVGYYYYVAPGGSVVYRGLSGTDLLLGRTGLYCTWGHVFPDGTVEEGDCYSMGGGFTYTVRALPTPDGQAGLTLAIANNALGADGGPVDLTSATTDGSAATDLKWYFIADHVSEETDPAPVETVADAMSARASLSASSSGGTTRASNAGAGRAPAPGRRVRAINSLTGDTTVTTDISTLPAGDYVFLSADSMGAGVPIMGGASFSRDRAATSRLAPSAGPSASHQLSPLTSSTSSVGSPNPYDGNLPVAITGSATLDGCAESTTCSANLRVDGGTFVVTGMVHGVLRAAEQRVAAGAGGGGPTLQVVCLPKAPVRGDDVHCVVSMTDGSEFLLKTLTSTFDGQALVQANVNSTLTTFDWTGDAVVPTRVDAAAIVAGKPATAFDSFDPAARVFADADQPPRPAPIPTRGKPNLGADYPGMRNTPTGWATLLGGLGKTWHLFPDYDPKQVTSGPNTGLWYVRNFRWVRSVPPGAAGPIADGIYMSVALFPGDPLYEMQDGKSGYCGKKDFDILRSEVYEHEVEHRASEIALRKQLKLHEVYETFVMAPPPGTPLRNILESINEPVSEYNEKTLANDNAVDTPGFSTTLTCQPRGLP